MITRQENFHFSFFFFILKQRTENESFELREKKEDWQEGKARRAFSARLDSRDPG